MSAPAPDSVPDPMGAEDWLPVVYHELRRLAGYKLAHESPGQTLQPTALVHEAWLRLAKGNQSWVDRQRFIAAAAEAMRRILIERARRRNVLQRGGYAVRTECTESKAVALPPAAEVLAVSDALEELATIDRVAATLVKLRYFVGLSMQETADTMDMPLRSAERIWTFARAWLRHQIHV